MDAAPPDCDVCLSRPGTIDAILALRIDEASWGGGGREDIFIPWGTSDIIVTERIVELAREHDLANVTTIPIEQYRWDPLRKHS